MTTFPAGVGEMAALIRHHDWAATPLGAIESWPQSLRAATNLIIATPVPIVMLWGPTGVMIYNDGYSMFAGGRHPSLLGSNVLEGWPEVADFNRHVMEVGLAGGTLSYTNHMLELARHGTMEQVWLNLDYSPVFGDDGKPAGVFANEAETTENHLAQGRTAALHALSDRLRDTEDPDEMAYAAAEVLGKAVGAVRVGYGRVDIERETMLVQRDWTVDGVASLVGERRLRAYADLFDTLRSGEQVIVPDIRTDPRTLPFAELLEDMDVRSFVNTPIIEQGELVALLFVNFNVPHVWKSEDLALLREIADRTRTAVDRAASRATLDNSVIMLGFLDRLGRAMAATRDADEVLELVTRMTGEHMALSSCAYAEMDEDESGFTILGDWTAPGLRSIVGHYSIDALGEPAANGLKAGNALIIRDTVAELPPAGARMFASISVRATICMPLIKDGKLSALMAINSAEPRDWSAQDKRMIRAVTERSWVHIDRVRAESELRKSAAALRDLAETLEQRVEERTAQLGEAEDALRQSQKMEAVGQLTGGLAHDFNNLLTGISGSLEMMHNRVAQGRISELERYFTAANGAVKRAAALTHRLLAFSRRQTLDPKATNVNRLIHDLEELVRRTVGPSVIVEVVGSSGLWPTLIDPNQLENAVLNLCINARDAMPQGGRLTIETANRWLDERAAREQDLPPGQYVSLCVTDTGTGMTPEVAGKAFDPFFTTKPLGEGTGLGLSMIYGFARQSGGQVRIYTELGQGTTMCLYLPRHDAAPDAEELIPADAVVPHGDGEVVMVIDDEPTIRMLVAEVLTDAGYAVIEAGDGPSGLRILESNARIDLLVTDVGLPGGMNGRQVADAARAARPDLRILFITGYAENAAVGNGHLDRGMSVMTKPFQMDKLAAKIREILES